MKKIAAVIIDTYPDKFMAAQAINYTLKCNRISKIYTFSDEPYFPGAEFVKIPKISSIREYEDYCLGGMLEYLEEDILLIQWDGFIVHPNNWRREFLDCDYIGAPHDFGNGFVVGNGGFSFRSLKLLLELRSIQKTLDNSLRDLPEDILIGNLQKHLEDKGMIFASLDLASYFSYQDGPIKDFSEIFGFHSPWNFPNFFHENSLLPIADKIIGRINKFGILTNYLHVCLKCRMTELFTESIHHINSYPSLVKSIDDALSDTKSSYHRDIFIRIMNGDLSL